MAKCAIVGCNRPPVGAFEERIDASSFDDPNGSLPGMRTGWCDEHEDMIRPTVLGKRGRWLTPKELEG